MNNPQPHRRSDCPISYGLDIFGDRWTLLVLRDLLLKGKRHFREFQSGEEGIATNVLADRLKRLEAHGIVERGADPDDRRQVIYRATIKGLSLMPVLVEIAAWGACHDENTGAPEAFRKRFETDREGLIKELIDSAKR